VIVNSQPTVIDVLANMPYQFHLTGSKFFTGRGKDTDFFVEFSEELQANLSEIGFKHLNNSNYSDSNCLAVMRINDPVVGSVDIQLIKDVYMKVKVQDVFKSLGYARPCSEDWDLAFAVFLCK
jgi:hypothetical protein